MSEGRRGWIRVAAELALVVALAVGPLLPFLDKAFHIDDYSYLRAARQILSDPLRPYDFQINWRGTSEPAWQMMNKPPLVPYVLALGIRLFGEQERPLHALFLVFPVVSGLSLYAIARRCTRWPLWPTLAFLACPAALVGSTNLMLDNPSLALYLAAIAAFLSAEERRSAGRFWIAGVLIGVATWSNYVCLSLLPLLALYLIVKERRVTLRLAYLLIPAAFFGLWCLQGWWANGTPDILVAAGHHADEGEMPYFYPALIALLTFTGGCIAPLLVLSPFITRGWLQLAVALGAAIAGAAVLGFAGRHLTPAGLPIPLLGIGLGAVFAFAGVSIFYLAGRYLREEFSAERLLLVAWIGGIAAFLLFFNWTVAARFLLFLAPPALIIGFHALEERMARPGWRVAIAAVAVAGSLALSLGLARADTRWANEQRRRALEIRAALPGPVGRSYFLCHWGLQYYFERAGLKPFDLEKPEVELGACLVVASVSSGHPIPPGLVPYVTLYRHLTYQPGLSLQLQSPRCGAGFYTHKHGPLPFTVSAAVQEEYAIYRVSGR